MSECERLRFWIQLLEMEVEALRSVISELEFEPVNFTQWQKAQAIDQMKNIMVRP